ncbi:SH3 domain-containing protein [Helicobacter burdigaliensis]|uniref:SH3 domain-containing protein n=1 Tax=Helicobacter burdigaliensis TaxID=2315334 RepID=UPI000EF708B4|nr:SH3 domain-containing protein [Helicobacter burdigaliensis]
MKLFSILERFFKLYSIPIFILVLSFGIYYIIFEVVSTKDNTKIAKTEEEIMQITQVSKEPFTPSVPPKQQETKEVLPSLEDLPKSLEEPKKQELVVSKVPSLNIRKEPNTNSDIMGKLTPTLYAVILEQQGDWILIGNYYNHATLGWVLKSYTKPYILENNPPLEEVNKNAKESSLQKDSMVFYTSRVPALNIRQAPNTQSEILGKLTPEDMVEIIEEQGSWVKIKDAKGGNKEGWVVKRSLEAF